MKSKIINQINSQLQDKIDFSQRNIAAAKESRDNDTKSSAGDKFETGREIINAEISKGEQQLALLFKLQSDLAQINLNKHFDKVEFGALVSTNQGRYFISIPFGKVQLEDQDIYAISLASPIGRLLFEKQTGESILFNGRKIEVLEVG